MKLKIGKYIKHTILIDNEDYFKVNNLDLYSYAKGVQAKINGKHIFLRYIIAGVKSSKDCNIFVIHANNNMLDFRKKNLLTISRKETVANRDYRYAETKTRGAKKGKISWSCNKTYNNILYYKGCESEQEALEMYDAISDYLRAKGHRNFPEKKTVLTDEDFKKFGKYKRK